ncbi:MAG: LuxR C-terminal-related transcriptional regulator [Chitinophagaceae bacterium]
MKYKNDLQLTYMGNMHQAWYANEVADVRDIRRQLDGFRQFDAVIHHAFPLFFAIDYTAHRYLVMTEGLTGISGYHPRDFLDTGLDKLIDVFHKDDFTIFNKKVFARNAAFLKSRPQEEHGQYIFSYNFRFAKSDRSFAQVMQRSSYITSRETGLPLYSIGMVMDITDIKSDTSIVHTIERVKTSGNTPGKSRVETNYFYPNEEDTLLTRQEKNILQWMADGLSSKMIADKLKISENTVANHRQSMLRKTNTANVAQLIAFAVRNRII